MKPFLPPELTRPEVYAIKALAEGKADAAMQRLALNVLLEKLCGTYDISYRSDDDGGDRDTAFAEGRRLVGIRLRQIIVQPVDFFVKEQEQQNDGSRSGSRSSEPGRQPTSEGTRRGRRSPA